MKLKKVYFDAFKCLLNKELQITEKCMGFVGINESGKSNILYAINVLGGKRELSIKDIPKMAKDCNPTIRFEFELSPEEQDELKSVINEWVNENTLIEKDILPAKLNVIYHVILNKDTNTEERFFSISNLKLNKDLWVLGFGKLSETFKIKSSDSFVPLNKAIIVNSFIINDNVQYYEQFELLNKLNGQIVSLKNEIKVISETKRNNNNQIQDKDIEDKSESVDESRESSPDQEKKKEGPEPITPENNNEVSEKQKQLDGLIERKAIVEKEIEHFNLSDLIASTENELSNIDLKLKDLNSESDKNKKRILELEKLEEPNDEQKKELKSCKKNQDGVRQKIKNLKNDKNTNAKLLENLKEPIDEKYTDDASEINKHLKDTISKVVEPFLPKVVFWEHSKDYILQSETLFSDIINKDSLDEISRPLVNVFRIGLNIKNLENLKSQVAVIQNDPNERSRLNERLNLEINRYVKGVWSDYDQKIKISLEEERIRIEIFDPETTEASYYNMEERSQGCQTFLSFLMTIGAESKQGVMKNYVLLLDEPETHLHPSGVRYMLKELVKISERDNIVIFATHSIFMIDRSNYDRHIILEKKNEQTSIKPSRKDKIGFFMQEEVLYSTLDINLNKEFKSTNLYNFVFEGDGDAIIFEHYYNKIIEKDERPFHSKNTSFYQGGKCSDIQKYFSYKPIQLGSKWIFVLDKDDPANKLKKFIEGKYKGYLSKDIYVFQYNKNNGGEQDIELEDLLPIEFMRDTFHEVFDRLSIGIENEKQYLDKVITEQSYFNDYSKKIISEHVDDNSRAFKEKLKETLNSRIKVKLKDLKDEDTFKADFAEYFTWVSNLITTIKDSAKAIDSEKT